MQVKNIIRNCAVLLDDDQLLSELDSTEEMSAQCASIKNKLVECVNIVNKKIATLYCPIKQKKVLLSNSTKISLSNISNEEIIEILQVCVDNEKISFSVENGYLLPKTNGYMTITYNILPKTLKYDDNISYYYNKVNENIFAYGVVSEYLYIMGNCVDAKMWEEKFSSLVSGFTTRRREIVMPVRGWY